MYYFAHVISIAQRVEDYAKKLFASRFKSKNWRLQEDKPPVTLKFETTNLCNANCIFCAYQYDTRPKGIMSMELFKRAFKEYIDMGGGNVAFAPMVGEPTLDPYLLKRLSIIKEGSSIKNCYLFTNGILLDKVGITQLLSSGVNVIHISTAGFDKDMYQRLYRSRKYDRVINNIHEILKKNYEMGKPVRITLEIRHDESVRKVLNKQDFKERISPYLDKKHISSLMYFDDWGGLIEKSDLSGSMKLAKPKRGKVPCSRTFSAMVTWDGKVRACACRSLFEEVDELIIGDLEKSSLEDIWYGDTLKDLRSGFEHGAIPKVCQNCSMYVPV
jgi:MoaA/NifB/PqqE/SkfB family radical SAM enzyme